MSLPDPDPDPIIDDTVDFLANMLQQADSKAEGYAAGCRWWCLRNELKAQYRQKARHMTREWATAERKIAEEMNKL